MTDRPILFSAPMVRAILDGRKTQTRRVLKPLKRDGSGFVMWPVYGYTRDTTLRRLGESYNPERAAPYAIGDRLWVKETHAIVGSVDPGWVLYRASGYEAECARHGFDVPYPDEKSVRWQSSLFMPRWASRITLEVTGVKVERLQHISEQDAEDEGATRRDALWSMDWSRLGQPSRYSESGVLTEKSIGLQTAVSAFANFINGLHDPRWNYKGDGIFAQDPWVAAISFERVG
jgi:hypothetical protein